MPAKWKSKLSQIKYALEVIAMKNYTKTSIGNEGRVEFHEALGLTGAEVSVNRLPAGTGVPFVHSHKAVVY